MKSLKCIFFGTPDFAKASLEAIFQSEHKVLAVVTAPDKASGRGQNVKFSPIKDFAVEHQLPLFQPEKLKDQSFLNTIKALNADVFVVVAFRMMPEVLFSMPKKGTFNIHGSLLPDYRGAAPINFAIINGEKKTGVTSFFINEKIDEGHILLQLEREILDDDHAGSLHDKLMHDAATLCLKTLDGLANENLTPKEQKTSKNPKTAYKIFKENTWIDWNKNVESIHNFVRGMSPIPAAITKINIQNSTKILKIYSGTFINLVHNLQPGTLIADKNSLKIYTFDGYYCPTELQLEGKKRMHTKDFLNGFQHPEQLSLAVE